MLVFSSHRLFFRVGEDVRVVPNLEVRLRLSLLSRPELVRLALHQLLVPTLLLLHLSIDNVVVINTCPCSSKRAFEVEGHVLRCHMGAIGVSHVLSSGLSSQSS